MIPVSVIVVTKNEEKKLSTCLDALSGFSQVIVVDSASQDKTADIAKRDGVDFVNFIWSRQYPKKRQWCLDNLDLRHDWVLFVDADEIVTDGLKDELTELFSKEPEHCGYFIKSRYVMNGKILRHGLQNKKLVLFDKTRVEFPLVDDLDIPGMGEIEGHYQPIIKAGANDCSIGELKSYFIHDALDDQRAWEFRHHKYARWEQGMNEKNAWPEDPKLFRNCAKKMLRHSRFHPQLVYFISYILLFGFLDGREGRKFAKMKKDYYALINK